MAHRELTEVGFLLSAEYAPMQTLPGEEQVVYRFPGRPASEERAAERRPKVLVVDFLLGDEGTALDLLIHLRERDTERKIQCILWTDERSVSVAVTAMKLGARDYIELGGLKDVEKLLRSIEEAIASAPSDEPLFSRRSRTVARASEEPIAQAAASRQSLAAGEMVAPAVQKQSSVPVSRNGALLP